MHYKSLRSLIRDIPLLGPFCRVLLHAFQRASNFVRRMRVISQRKEAPAQILPVYTSQALNPEPTLEHLGSQLCTQKQFKSPIYKRWCSEIREVARFHRKQWEFVYILEALRRYGMLAEGKTGLGFGCGREPLPAVMAGYGCQVLATDLDPERALNEGWRATSQHVADIEELFEHSRGIVDKETFFRSVRYREVDMNNIPSDLTGQFDFVWSACSLEHLGSLEHGTKFILNSLQCLKPGGVAVHTTEFNLSSDTNTCEIQSLSIFRKQDILKIFETADLHGFKYEPLNTNAGNSLLDNYIDIPPYLDDPHIKVLVSAFVTTSVGIVLRRPM